MNGYPNRFQSIFELKDIEKAVLGEWGEEEWGEYYENLEATRPEHPDKGR